MIRCMSAIFAVGFVAVAPPIARAGDAAGLQVEHATAPLAVSEPTPLFSWYVQPNGPGADTAASPQFRTTFTVPAGKTVAWATLAIVGLGVNSVEIDGEPLGTVLDAGYTDYNKRILYMVHDVTTHGKAGDVVRFDYGEVLGAAGKASKALGNYAVGPRQALATGPLHAGRQPAGHPGAALHL